MDERFRNLTRTRNYNLAVVVVVVLALVLILVNRFVYPYLAEPYDQIERYASYSFLGIVFAEFAILAVWCSLSHQSGLVRFQTLGVAGLVLLASWLLGFSATFNKEVGLNWANQEVIYYLGILPVLFLAATIPLTLFRFFSGYVLAPLDLQNPPLRKRLSIMHLIGVTTAIATSLALVQLPVLIDERPVDMWISSGIFSSIFFGVGLIALLPSSLWLFSPRRSFMIGAFSLFTMSLALTLVLTYFISSWARFRWPNPWDMLIPTQATASGAAVFLLAMTAIRLLGYRLTKSQPIGFESKSNDEN